MLDDKWQVKYNLAKKYYEQFNNLEIPRSYKTTNGYEYDKEGINLGTWLDNQKQRFNSLSKEKKLMLLDIGLIIDLNNKKIK